MKGQERNHPTVGSALRADRPRHLVPSGIDWIGDMPEGWNCGKVEYYYSIQLGKMLDSNSSSEYDTLEKYYCAANVHFEGGVDSSDLKEMWFSDAEKATYRIKPGDLLVVEGGAGAGGSAVLKEDVGSVYMQNSIMRVRPGPTTDNQYLCYWLEYVVKSGYMELVCNKATIPHFTKEKLGRVVFPIPPLPEQQAIAAKLDEECGRIDSLTAKIEKEIAALEEYRKSLITKCVTKGLNEREVEKRGGGGQWNSSKVGGDLRAPRKMVNSGVDWIGDVPEGWKVMRLSYQYTVQLGKMLDSAQITGDFLVPYLRNQDVQWNWVNTDDLPMMDIRPEEYCRCSAKRGDLLVCEGGEIGRSAIWRSDEPVFYQKAIMRLRPYDAQFNTTSWMYYLMCAATSCGAFDNATGKSTIAHLPAEKLQANKFPFPSVEEQREIAAFLDKKCAAIDAVLAKRRKQLEGLAEYRKSMIYAYVTGKKEVAA